MARFEGALAIATARAGFFPQPVANAIAQACGRATFNIAALAHEARNAGTLAIPFVAALRAQVPAEAARYVHFGATSQDAMDTAAALCMKQAAERITALAVELGDSAAALARRHANTPMLARTLLQPAAPVPFGWKCAMWLAPLARALPHWRAAVEEGCVLQFGGAAGTLSAFRDKGPAIAEILAKDLGLKDPVTWHSARDGFARLGSELAILTGIAAKIARDVTLLMQPEVGEVAEPSGTGRGGSSSMPHKRNPSGSLLALEAAQRAPGLAATLFAELLPEHERGLGQWQNQWSTLRALALGASSALGAMAYVLKGLELDAAAMQANIDETGGLVFSEAVALRLSRALADRLCAQALHEKKDLREVMRSDAEVGARMKPEEIDALFDANKSFGAAEVMLERVLADWQANCA
ncbi:MAG: 3-carboxy-cis,cis-muconate cycloisomerase [Betaproteobacteria bacterium]|nr:MAG: 3-carboxy-cis,cis-muconate cycloisomerase [Betaproteobacteria bacterium]